ncbi:MAG: TetR/AcrR family transcriptional regulator [Bacilli bacterium]
MTKDGNTRKQLIDSAYKVLAKKGYEAASVKEIASEAGVSPGLIHYYFASKEELFMAVVKEATDEYCRQMQSLRATFSGSKLAGTALAEPMQRSKSRPDWYRLRYELFVLGLRNPSLLPGVKELILKGREGVMETIQAVAPNLDAETLNRLAAILFACFDGLALQALVDPDFDIDGSYALLAQMATGFVETEVNGRDQNL